MKNLSWKYFSNLANFASSSHSHETVPKSITHTFLSYGNLEKWIPKSGQKQLQNTLFATQILLLLLIFKWNDFINDLRVIVKTIFFWEWSLSSSSSLKRWRRKEDLVSSWPRLSHSYLSWPWPSRRPAPLKQVRLYLHRDTCDQIGRFIGLWATFSCLWQQLICPNLPHSKVIFVKVSKSIIFLVK